MGEPMKIIDMAYHLISLSGFEPHTDIPIKIIGLRPGEKLYEELWNVDEKPTSTGHRKILSAQSNQIPFESLTKSIATLTRAADAMDEAAIFAEFAALIPDYGPDEVETPPQATLAASLLTMNPAA